MSYSGRSRYMSPSCSLYRRGRSLSRSRSRSRSQDSSVENPGNNLYVTGLSPRITKEELEKHFASEGKVTDIHLVVDPWTRESRGFGFVTMATLEDADRCIKYLDGSVLEGRVITVEKARRRRGRTPTPGRYLGLRTVNERRRSPSCSPRYRSRYNSPGYSSERDRSYSPCYRRRGSRSSYYRRHGSRSYSPYYRRCRSRSRSYSPYYRRHRSRSYSPCYYRRGSSRSYSPYYYRRDRSRSYYRSPYDSRRRSRSPIRGHHWSSYSRDSRSYSPSQSVSPYDRSVSPVKSRRRRRFSRTVSPKGRSYCSRRSPPPPRGRSYSRSHSPVESGASDGSYSHSPARSRRPRLRSERRYSRESYSHSRSWGSRSVSASSSARS